MKGRTIRVLRYLTYLVMVLLAIGGILLVMAGSIWGVSAVVAAAIALSLVWKWVDTRCPHCRRGFALGTPHREEVSREDAQVLDAVGYRNDAVRENFSCEGVVKGTRIVYRETCLCRRCRKTVERTVVVEHKH